MMHTKGPWTIDRNGKLTDFDGIPTIFIFGADGQGYGRVAMAYAESGRVDELEPNARLIAAAPELLEAMERVASAYAHIETCNMPAWLDAVEEAIRNAKEK